MMVIGNKIVRRQSQKGTTAVEFAVVGLVFFTVMFGLIDISRIFFEMAALDEATRRGARVAAVCPIDDPLIGQATLFNGLIPTLATGNINLEYLNADGDDVDDPAGADYGSIRFVRVGIQNFQIQMFIPGFSALIPMPAFETTIPSESLGRVGVADVPC